MVSQRVPILLDNVMDVQLYAATLMGPLYESFNDEDGFLYMCYSSEKTFG